MNDNISDAQGEIKRDAKIRSWLYGGFITLFISVITFGLINFDTPIRFGLGFAVFVTAIYPVFKVVFYFLSRDLSCKACHAPYSINLISSKRDFISAIPRSKIQNQGVVSGDRRGPDYGKQVIIKSHWTEERYNITNFYSCVSCGENHSTQHIEKRQTGYSSSKIYQ